MAFRKFDVIQPANEKELGEQLRNEALASGVLNLVVLEVLNELDAMRNREGSLPENVSLQIDSLHLGEKATDKLPFINGYFKRLSSGSTGTGRLEINGSHSIPEDERKLTLHTHEEE